MSTFSQGSTNDGWTTNAVKFGSFTCVGIVLIDRDGAHILVISGSGVDELEGKGGTGHESEEVNEKTGGLKGGEERSKDAFLMMRGKI